MEIRMGWGGGGGVFELGIPKRREGSVSFGNSDGRGGRGGGGQETMPSVRGCGFFKE